MPPPLGLAGVAQLRSTRPLVFFSKRHVAAAFKLIYVSIDDVGGMATELDGSALRKLYKGTRKTLQRGAKIVNMIALYLVLVFGWLGAPGEWVVWSWALTVAFGSHGPASPGRDAVEKGARLG